MKDESSPPHSAEPSGALIASIQKLLKPFIKLLISHGVTLPSLLQMIKSGYVAVAEEDFSIEGRKLTDSRISLITGVHRKDVQKLRHAVQGQSAPPASISIGTRLVSVWVDDDWYLDGNGAPRVLPFRAANNNEPSFESLVETVSRKDLHPRVVMDELVRLGIVTVDEERVVRLNVEGFVPDRSFDEKAWYFGQNISAHIATGVHNLNAGQPPMIERSVSYSGLTESDIARLEEKCRSLGMGVLKKINHDARQMKENHEQAGAPGDLRFTFGLFVNRGKAASGEGDEHT